MAWVLTSQAKIDELRGRYDEAAATLARAEELFSQSGSAWALARVNNLQGWVTWKSGDAVGAERRFRDAIRILQPVEDRGTLCESQRALAQVLLENGKTDEAERYALEARMTVGQHDHSSRATTRMALGLVRAAQGRDEEAETLLREALAVIVDTDLLHVRCEVLTALADFLRDRGRDEEAALLRGELAGYTLSVA